MDRRHFFFSVELSYPRVLTKRRLGRPRRFRDQLSQKSLASRTFIVQHGPAVVSGDAPHLRTKLGKDWPVCAVKLVDGLAGESPASASFPVGTVVIPGDGAGDQPVESPEVNVLDGWMRIWSAPTGGQAKQQVVAKANRS